MRWNGYIYKYDMLLTAVRSKGPGLWLYLCVCMAVRESDAGCHPSALRPDGMPVLCGVTRVGLLAKGLLIKGDMDLELVLMCREKPTKLLLYTISANLPLQIQVPSVTPPALQCSARCIQNEPWKHEKTTLALKKCLCDPSFSGNACPQRTTRCSLCLKRVCLVTLGWNPEVKRDMMVKIIISRTQIYRHLQRHVVDRRCSINLHCDIKFGHKRVQNN